MKEAMMTDQQAREDNGEVRRWRVRGPGGTSGGLGSFVLGGALFIGGAYLIMNQVQVTSGYWYWWGPNTFGLTLLPLIVGIGLLFFDGSSLPGCFLCGAGIIIIFPGLLVTPHMFSGRK